MTRYLVMLVLAVLACVRVAHADDAAMKAAKRHFDRGEKLFALGKFDEALDQYQQAFDAKPIPAFLFNIAQCHRNLGDYDAAIFSFKKYLQLEPEAPNREKVEELIQELEDKKAEADTERLGLGKRGDPTPPVENPGGKPVYTRWWFWTGIAVVGVGAGVGVYALTQRSNAPTTDLGNMVFGK
jgi:tetratricopeptide (TPR) repeat protein